MCVIRLLIYPNMKGKERDSGFGGDFAEDADNVD